jgi:hypothetical protein
MAKDQYPGFRAAGNVSFSFLNFPLFLLLQVRRLERRKDLGAGERNRTADLPLARRDSSRVRESAKSGYRRLASMAAAR